MAEYIEREAVYADACKGCTSHGVEVGSCFAEEPCERLIRAFATAPAADVVAVVRCRECAVPHNRWTGCPKMNGTIMPPDGFCAYGERRDNDAAD